MLTEKLNEYIQNPESAIQNYELALEYDKIGQLASAVSFYIRAAERSEEPDLIYDSLVLAASCFERQNRRKFTVEGLLQHAISVLPNRPEAYFHLCRLYETMKKWRELILFSSIGLTLGETEPNQSLKYTGFHSFLFYNAIGNYNIGLFQKAKQMFFELAYMMKNVNIVYKTLSRNNLLNLGFPDILSYDKSMADRFRFPFGGIETIDHNYAKHFQDMFVLSVLNGKKNGYYIEIGAGDPYETNNTVLLEKQFGWKGISFDINPIMCYEFSEKRSNPILRKDVTKTDLAELFREHCAPEKIDYLQIDCDESSLEALYRIPFDDHTFGVIQFEHDSYRLDPDIKQKAKEYLESKGYFLLVNNVAFNEKDAYEDWWVHPSLIKPEMIAHNDINFVITYMLKGIEE